MIAIGARIFDDKMIVYHVHHTYRYVFVYVLSVMLSGSDADVDSCFSVSGCSAVDVAVIGM